MIHFRQARCLRKIILTIIYSLCYVKSQLNIKPERMNVIRYSEYQLVVAGNQYLPIISEKIMSVGGEAPSHASDN